MTSVLKGAENLQLRVRWERGSGGWVKRQGAFPAAGWMRLLRADGPEFLLQCADSSTHDSFRDTTPEKMRSRPSLPPFPLSVRSPACAHTGISDGPHVACVCIVSRMHYSDSGLLGCVGGILKCGTCCTIRRFCLLLSVGYVGNVFSHNI